MSEYDNDTVLSTMRVNFIFPNISHLLWEWTLFSQVYLTYNERELYFRKYSSLTAVLILFLSIKLEIDRRNTSESMLMKSYGFFLLNFNMRFYIGFRWCNIKLKEH